MQRAVRCLILAFGWLLAAEGLTQVDSPDSVFGLSPGERSVGFRLLDDRDRSRSVTGGLPGTAHPRPMRVYLWYPAEHARGAQPLRFGDYAALADDDIWPREIAGDARARLAFSRGPLARSLGARELETLSRRPVHAVENAEALPGPFPLVVIGTGIYYESPVAFAAFGEYLAGRGFVVASVPFVGTDSVLVKVDAQDLETQVRDLELAIARARELAFVDQERLGVFGFDMGGMAGVVLAMRNPDVDAFASADAGILYPHPSGLPRAAPDYAPSRLRVPWLFAGQPGVAARPPGFEGPSLFDEAVHSDRYLLVAEAMDHVDFTSYALVDHRDAVLGYWRPGTPEGARAHAAFAEYVYHFLAAFLERRPESRAFLARAPEEAFSGAGIAVEHRPAIAATIGYPELVTELISGRAADAVEKLRSMDDPPLDENGFWRLGYSLLFTWGLAAEAIPLLELMVERYPASADAKSLLAEAYVADRDFSAALSTYEKYLEQRPNDERARNRLESLRDR